MIYRTSVGGKEYKKVFLLLCGSSRETLSVHARRENNLDSEEAEEEEEEEEEEEKCLEQSWREVQRPLPAGGRRRLRPSSACISWPCSSQVSG